MLENYSTLQFIVRGKIFKGFCMRINDDFHETYAVVLDGYHSFCIWLDNNSSKWYASKNVVIDPDAIDEIINRISLPEQVS
ncbi:hypothetical protein EZ449_09000 [Pedobacter frigidisoli]|uniref:Uncharacterized protein n=1 Tax=Pedobacter frigidisoli TaxID=2530455 RepID=A0A4R0P165_9SPHI|nr:hypothetical protein [Pedobacter frigidisoli]TCD10476.1 hypothetical protein EZ449_09000 [Pedobacter frigidisoli]